MDLYGQYCGLARALEMVGERWSLLIVRDLLVGPKSFGTLLEGLPGITADELSARLEHLEQTGVVQSQRLRWPAGGLAYWLTDYGVDLDDSVRLLARWGARSLGDPRPGEIVTAESLVMALRTTFHAEAALGFHASYEVRLGDHVLHARIDNGVLETGEGPLRDADLVLEPGPALRPMMAGELTPHEALSSGAVTISGDPRLLDRFVEIFQISGALALAAA